MNQTSYSGICRPYAHMVDQIPAGMFYEKQDGWALIQAVMMEANVVLYGEWAGQFGAIEYWLRNAFRHVEAEDRLLFFNHAGAAVDERCRMAADLFERNQKARKRYGLNSTIVRGGVGMENGPLRLASGLDLRIQVRLPASAEAVTSKDIILFGLSETKGLPANAIHDYQDFLEGVGFTSDCRNLLADVLEFDKYRAHQASAAPTSGNPRPPRYLAMKTAAWVNAARWMKGAAAMEGRNQVEAADFHKLAYALRPGFFEVSPELKSTMVQESWYPRIASYLKT